MQLMTRPQNCPVEGEKVGERERRVMHTDVEVSRSPPRYGDQAYRHGKGEF